MFGEFLYILRAYGVRASTTEWLSFQQALASDLMGVNLDRFYELARALLVKSEAQFDRFDLAFAEHFRGVVSKPELKAELMRWLAREVHRELFSEAELEAIASMPLDELIELFKKRLEEQTEEHNGGSKWVGTQGRSPFGHSGQSNAPAGIRVGGEGGLGRAMKIASARRYRNLRTDQSLNVRQLIMALRQLRALTREGRREELDVEGTIRRTCDNAGELELVFHPERRNSLKLMLLCDVGGSMEPFRVLSERLFSAAHKTHHFHRFRSYYFHNCVYSELYTDMARARGVPLGQILKESSKDECVIFVGDAAMAPSELFMAGGNIDYWVRDESVGMDCLKRLKLERPRAIWLNPLPQRSWAHPTIHAIRETFPMFELTLDGLGQAIDCLRRNGRG